MEIKSMPHDDLHFIVDKLSSNDKTTYDRQYWLTQVKNGENLTSSYLLTELKGDTVWTMVSYEFVIQHLSNEDKTSKSIGSHVYNMIKATKELINYDDDQNSYDYVIGNSKHPLVEPFIKIDPTYANLKTAPVHNKKFLVIKYDALLKYLMTIDTDYGRRLRNHLLDCKKAFQYDEIYINQLEKKLSTEQKIAIKKETEQALVDQIQTKIIELEKKYEEERIRRLAIENEHMIEHQKYEREHAQRVELETKYDEEKQRREHAEQLIANFDSAFFESEELKRINSKPTIAYPDYNPIMPQQYFMILYIGKQMRRVDNVRVFQRHLFKMLSSAKVHDRIASLQRKSLYSNIRVISIYRSITMIDPKRILRKILNAKGLMVKRINGEKHNDLFTTKATCNIDNILTEFNSIAMRTISTADNAEVIQHVMEENKNLLGYVNKMPKIVEMLKSVMQKLQIATDDSDSDIIEENDDTSDDNTSSSDENDDSDINDEID